MDLGTIKKRLLSEAYESVDALAEDVRRVTLALILLALILLAPILLALILQYYAEDVPTGASPPPRARF